MYPAYDQITRSGAHPLPLQRRFHLPDRAAHADWRGIFGGQTQPSPEALFTHVCGLKVIVPSNPVDARAC